MKLFRISLLLFCVMFFSSCIAERGDRDCYGRFTLYFEYKPTAANPNTVATFLQHVHMVDVFVFDQAGTLAYYRPSVNQADMRPTRGGTRSGNPGIDLPVGSGAGQLSPGGRYRVVVWGNADRQRNSFGNPTQLNAARIGTAPDGGTPLHFGPGSLRAESTEAFWIDIPQVTDEHYAVMEFSRAHIEIQVFVVGAAQTPTVNLNGVFDGINFDNEVSTSRIPFNQLADTNRPTPTVPGREARQAAFASFYVPLFEETDHGKLLVIENSNGVLENGIIRLSDIIAGTTPDNINVGRPARIRLADTNVPVENVQIVLEVDNEIIVGIWLPGWIHNATDPGLG